MKILINVVGAKLDLKNDEEQTAMHLAAQFGRKSAISALLEKDPRLISDLDVNNNAPILGDDM